MMKSRKFLSYDISCFLGVFRLFTIVSKTDLSPAITRMEIHAPLTAAKAQAGQFVIVQHRELGERIPLTLADWDVERGTVTLIIQRLGKSTWEMTQMSEGEELTALVGPLGRPTHYDLDLKRVLAVAGGVGAAPLYAQVKALVARGVEVDLILGARDAENLILVDEMTALCHSVHLCTDDGSRGHHGRVTDLVQRLWEQGERYDHAVAIGPLPMMQAVCRLTKLYDLPTIVSMNPIMIDGTGMCGGCRVTVGGEVKFACVDGPEFDGHAVDFAEAMRRQSLYRGQEREALDGHLCRVGGGTNA